jgi:RNA polymerase sigma factor (sigma-70 family)
VKNSGIHGTIREPGALFNEGAVGMLSDGQLLDRFVERREASAFEAIVERYGPLAWGVCRRVLRDHHDAEDAFQATFLVLARKAASVMPREKLGNWLYGVAFQTAMKARATRAKRRVRELPAREMIEPEAVPDEHVDELLSRLDREVTRLPEKYRMPIVLCELEGKTHRQAAEQLGWPVGTVSGRLSRARALLAHRLSRRDTPLTAGVVGVLLAHDAAWAGVPADLVRSTAQAASLSMAGKAATAGVVSARVVVLTGEVLKTMLLNKLKLATAMLLAALSLAAGGTSFVGLLPAAVQETTKSADSVTIRVVDDRGRPISGADVWMQVILHDNATGTLTDQPTGHGTTNDKAVI